jgi:hypothetical protein
MPFWSTQALGAAVSNMALGYTNTCVLLASGGVDCWGKNDEGQLANGSTTDSLFARPVRECEPQLSGAGER